MDFLIADSFFWITGLLFLFIRYGNRKKVIAVRDLEFNGSYTEAGRSVLSTTALVLFGIAIFALIVLAFISLLRK